MHLLFGREGWPEDSEAVAAALREIMPSFAQEEERKGGGGAKTVKMSSDVAAVMKREAIDSRQDVEKKRKRREVDCALFIPADTSVSLIHLEKGIGQITTYTVAFALCTYTEHTPTTLQHKNGWSHHKDPQKKNEKHRAYMTGRLVHFSLLKYPFKRLLCTQHCCLLLLF